VARTQTKPNITKINLKANQIQPGIQLKITQSKGGIQPPKNKITNNADIKMILEYSAKKNKVKITLEYSTLKPETNSDSASGKSKGTRLVSANILMKNKIQEGNKGKQK